MFPVAGLGSKNFQSHRLQNKFSDEVYDEYFDFDYDLFSRLLKFSNRTLIVTRTSNAEYVLQGVDSILADLRSPLGYWLMLRLSYQQEMVTPSAYNSF